MSTRYLALGGIIMDDIVFPDGRTMMNTLGGGGLYAAAGMRLWSSDVSVVARVGPDFEFSLLDSLKLGSDAIIVTDRPTPRAWQLYERDGTRTQIPRGEIEDWSEQLVPAVDILPDLTATRGIHVCGRGDAVELDVVATLADAGVTISHEPIVDDATTDNERELIFTSLANVDIFSPSLDDAHILLGDVSIETLLRQFAEMGPRIIALRQGEAGSLVYDREVDAVWHVPAAEATVVDVTGAGNAYCGGLLVGWCETQEVAHAAARAAVSAAVTIEQVGPPSITVDVLDGARGRVDAILAEITETETAS